MGVVQEYARRNFRRGITGEGIVGFVDKEITTAQMLALFGTPITVVAAPGADKAIIVDAIVLFLDFNTIGYTVPGTSELSFKYTNAAGLEILQLETTGFLDVVADATRVVKPAVALMNPTANAAVVVQVLIANVTAGNSPLKIRVYYRTIATKW